MKKTLALLGAMLLSAFALCGCTEAILEESAVPVVTSIIQDDLGADVSCESVKITKKISDKKYEANAKLDNGNTIKIVIEDRGDEVYVTIPFDQD